VINKDIAKPINGHDMVGIQHAKGASAEEQRDVYRIV
jgi:hypothetical protein